MEALLDSENLTREEILWAESHLPNNDSFGNERPSYHFRHDKENFMEAMNIPESDLKKAVEILSNITKNVMTKENYRMTHAIEDILNNIDKYIALLPIIISKTIHDAINDVKMKIVKDTLNL